MILFPVPRKSRIDIAGAVHHVMVRGIARSDLFYDNTERNRFIDRMETVFTEGKTGCYAFALLSNHVHLLVRTGSSPLSLLMRRLLTSYAISFNKRHGRTGHLFQNRYKSILCEEDPYFLDLVRYIHLNPLRAKLVPDLASLDRYPYSGHSALMGTILRPWLNTDYVLSAFRGSKVSYRAFVEAGVEEGPRDDLTGGGLVRSNKGWTPMDKAPVRGDERILGSSDFVLQAIRAAGEQWERSHMLKSQGVDFDSLCRHVAGLFELDPKEILLPGRYRTRVAARSVLCYFLVRELHMTTTEVGARIGLSQPAVSIAVARGEAMVREKGFMLPGEGQLINK
jgi:putative transposase